MQDREFNFKSSNIFLITTLIMIIATMMILQSFAVSLFYKITSQMVLICYAIYLVKQYYLFKAKNSITRIRKLAKSWIINTPYEELTGKLRGDSVVTPYISLLRFEVNSKIKNCLIFKDSLVYDEYRKLLIILRMG